MSSGAFQAPGKEKVTAFREKKAFEGFIFPLCLKLFFLEIEVAILVGNRRKKIFS